MIIHLKNDTPRGIIDQMLTDYHGRVFFQNNNPVVITASKVKKVQPEHSRYISESFVFDSDIQLASSSYLDSKRTIHIGDLVMGGEENYTHVIAGPCSVESEEQINETALFLKEKGVKILRAGSYKPRTSPYSFQGLGLEGLKLLKNVRENHGLKIISEVRDATHVDNIIEYTDIIQVGAKAMYDQGVLRACGEARKPVLIKRGFGSTLQEFVQAAEFVLSGGNNDVILCERGIRTFETHTRFTLDLCGVAFLKHHTNLPVVVDPSHAMGHAYGVPDLARAALAMGVDGLLIEVHPEPAKALSDASQQLDFQTFSTLYDSLKQLAPATGHTLI